VNCVIFVYETFTRGRGTMYPLEDCNWVGLAGGGVSKLADWLESGELTGVRVTEEISRLDSDVTSPHQDKADGLCKMYGSLETLTCRC